MHTDKDKVVSGGQNGKNTVKLKFLACFTYKHTHVNIKYCYTMCLNGV